MPRPEIKDPHVIDVSRKCYTCDYYGFVARPHNPETPGWAFCAKYNKHFPNQGPNDKPAGMNIWISFSGKYLGHQRRDDLDEMEGCEDCGGTGVDSWCDECRDSEEDEESR